MCDALRKYDLFHYLQFWHRDSSFPTYTQWKSIVKTKIREKENDEWLSYCQDHPDMHVAQACLLNTPPHQFWSLADDYPDLVSLLHMQVRINGNFGFSGGVPWLSHTQGALCFICKENVENVSYFLHDCPEFRQNFDSAWLNLKQKVISANPIDGSQIFDFISRLDRQQKTLLLLGGLSLPFDQTAVTMINRFICSAVSKIYRIRKNRLRELQAPWLKK